MFTYILNQCTNYKLNHTNNRDISDSVDSAERIFYLDFVILTVKKAENKQ